MLFTVFAFLLVQAPYKFEIDRGPMLEIKGGSSIQDSDDENTMGSGVRMGWSFVDLTDSYFSAEIDFTYHRFIKDIAILGQNKYLLDGNIVFYETFNPAAFRIALGGGVERRSFNLPTGLSDVVRYRATGNYRMGLGWYFTKDIGLYGDFTARTILNRKKSKAFDGAEFSTSYEVALSLQTIF